MHSTDNLDDGYLGSGKHLWNSIHKYGKENHSKEILEYLLDRNSLAEREKQIVNEELIHDKFCMNLMKGGKGGFVNDEAQFKRSQAGGKRNWELNREKMIFKLTGKKRTEETKRKLSECQKGNKNHFYNKHHTEESKEKIGLINSIKQKGEKNSQYGTCWITNNKENKKIKKEDINIYINCGWILGRITHI
jgi:group I intron endonuclease